MIYWDEKRFSTPHLTVHESLQLQLGDAKLAVLLGQTPARLREVDLGSPRHADVLWGLTQLQLVRPLQLEVLKTPERKKKDVPPVCHIFSALDRGS